MRAKKRKDCRLLLPRVGRMSSVKREAICGGGSVKAASGVPVPVARR